MLTSKIYLIDFSYVNPTKQYIVVNRKIAGKGVVLENCLLFKKWMA